MNWDADGIHLLTVNVQRANTLGHHRLGFDVAAVRGDLHGIAMGNAEFVRQLLADLHKLFRLRDGIQQRVLGPVVEVLGQTVSGADIRELVLFTQRFKIALEDTGCRVRDHVRVQRVSTQRRLKRLVVFRERTFRHLIDSKQAPHPFRLHDKRPDIAAWCGSAVVRNIHAAPFRAVPLQ
ncbi:Uncharacterised protein [Enterobacter kobei]|nr:Uncharacterised protein [Enterobacter kobei]